MLVCWVCCQTERNWYWCFYSWVAKVTRPRLNICTLSSNAWNCCEEVTLSDTFVCFKKPEWDLCERTTLGWSGEMFIFAATKSIQTESSAALNFSPHFANFHNIHSFEPWRGDIVALSLILFSFAMWCFPLSYLFKLSSYSHTSGGGSLCFIATKSDHNKSGHSFHCYTFLIPFSWMIFVQR